MNSGLCYPDPGAPDAPKIHILKALQTLRLSPIAENKDTRQRHPVETGLPVPLLLCQADALFQAWNIVPRFSDVVSTAESGLVPAGFFPGKKTAYVGFPLVRGPRLAGSGNSAFRNLMGTICCPSKSTGLVDSIPTFSRQRMWSRQL